MLYFYGLKTLTRWLSYDFECSVTISDNEPYYLRFEGISFLVNFVYFLLLIEGLFC
jgi:hypothetical protein